VSHPEFSTVMFLLRAIVDDTNVILYGTFAGLMNEQEIQHMVRDVMNAYARTAVTAWIMCMRPMRLGTIA
jgi:hypothetical protein